MSLLQGNFKREIRLSNSPETDGGKVADQLLGQRANEKSRENSPEFNINSPFVPGPDFPDKLAEDERLDYLLRMKHNMSEYFENMVYVPPHGMTGHDYKSIAAPVRERLEKHKMKIRRDNQIYLSKHPEIDAMLEICLKKLMIAQPSDPVKFIAEYFCVKQSSLEEHKKLISEERTRIARHRKAKSKEFEYTRADKSIIIRKLNLGPMADILHFSSLKEETAESEPAQPPPKIDPITSPVEPAPHMYCGCKDWKKNRKHELRVSQGEPNEQSSALEETEVDNDESNLESWEEQELETEGLNDGNVAEFGGLSDEGEVEGSNE